MTDPPISVMSSIFRQWRRIDTDRDEFPHDFRIVRGLVNGQQVEIELHGRQAAAVAPDLHLFGIPAYVRRPPAILCPQRPGNDRMPVRFAPGCHEYGPNT